MAKTSVKVDAGLLRRLTDLVLCSGCLRHGRKRPITQVISHRHRPRTLCTQCRGDSAAPGSARVDCNHALP